MTKQFQESVQQEFERFMRDEMDDIEKKNYIKSDRYKAMIEAVSKTLMEKIFKKKWKLLRFWSIYFKFSNYLYSSEKYTISKYKKIT